MKRRMMDRRGLEFLLLVGGLLTIVALVVIGIVAPGFNGWFGIATGVALLVVALTVRLPRAARVLGWLVAAFGLVIVSISVGHLL